MANLAAAGGGDGPRKPSGSVPTPNLRKGPKRFFAEVGRELKKVDWPARSETNRMTGVVLAVCLFIVGILTAMSVVFDWAIRFLTTGGGS